ncbi:MAG: ISAs1 family transposase [Egibacteraceae bacterium]
MCEGLVVRPVRRDEVDRFNTELDERHWLGHRIVGETMRYVATWGDQWVALVGFGSAALACAPRDRWIGWSKQQQFARLRCIVNNQRFCVLPQGRQPNLASAVLARTLRRVSADYQASYGHPVLVVETFTDPARHQGSCYAAAGFTALGMTLGYRRNAGAYIHHGNPKLVWARPLRRGALVILAALFDHPILSPHQRRPVIDLNALELDGPKGLLATLAQLPDARKRRGIRHRQASVLAIAAAAVLAGARSYTAIGEYAAELSQDVLARLEARRHPVTGRYTAPDESTLRRALQRVDPDALDAAIGGWLADQAAAGHVNGEALAVAVDGKSLRGAVQADGRPVHLFAAMIHNQGVVVAQREVGHKTNEITEFRPLLADLDLAGAVVTADALHTQRDHATFLVEEKNADYVFTVKDNQPKTLAAVESLFEQSSFPP